LSNPQRPDFQPAPVVLEGQTVRLEPLTPDHAEGLLEAGRDPAIWRWVNFRPFEKLDDARRFINQALAEPFPKRLPFAIIHRESGRVAGTTSYLDMRLEARGLEIGWTWIDTAHQRTRLNSECKFLLMRNAFEEWGAVRVMLKTDERNEQSQRAIERLGAKREGVLRRDMAMWDGFMRSSVYYSVLDDEWPEVKRRLLGFLER
jgi:RimJ/RimL family protein N-acetyltransferase